MSADLNITKIKVGQSANPAQNFFISTPTPEDGTLTIEREDSAALVVNSDLSISIPGNLSAFTAKWENISSQNGRLMLQVPETYDPTNSYSAGRFTPKVPGLYLVSASVRFQAGTVSYVAAEIQKNNAVELVSIGAPYLSIYGSSSISGLVMMNGTTDFIEVWQDISTTGVVTGLLVTTSATLIHRL